MNALIRWVPFRELADVHGSLSSILGRSHQNGASSQNSNEASACPDWVPVVDIAENDHGYLLKIEIPGVREDEISVKLDNRTLTISGERKPDAGDGVRYIRMERAHGSFTRRFELTSDVDPESVEARFRNGVLEVHLAKSTAAKPRVIQVKSE